MSFRTRLMLVMLLLTTSVQLVVAWEVLSTLRASALHTAEQELSVSLTVARHLLDSRAEQRRDRVERIAGSLDTYPPQTLEDAERLLDQAVERSGADIAVLRDADGRILASRHLPPSMIGEVSSLGHGHDESLGGVELVAGGDRFHQLAAGNLKGNEPAHSLVLGFLLSPSLFDEISRLTQKQTSIRSSFGNLDELRPTVDGEPWLEKSVIVEEGANGTIEVVARQSYEELFAPFRALRRHLLGTFAATFLVTVVVAVLIARSASLPVWSLVGAARSVGRGLRLDYESLPKKGEAGLLSRTLIQLQDDIARREIELHRQSRLDQLTRLGNRGQANEDIEAAIVTGTPFTLVRLTVNHMRRINDTFGHELGDQVLRMLAERLLALPTAKRGAYRLSGDEFLMLLDVPRIAPLWIADTYRRLTRPILLAGSSLSIQCALGEVRFPEHGREANLLLRRAEIALEHARAERSIHRCYLHGQDEHHLRRLTLVRDLQHATGRAELLLCFQPQVDAVSGRVTGVEALMRWGHPVLGNISPDEFIGLAEGSGNVQGLTNWLINSACQQLSQWLEQGLDLRMGINVSAMDLEEPGLVARVRAVMTRYGIEGRRLCVEVTESAIMQSPERSVRTLQALQNIGVELAIDDFGTGYSSLAQLKRLPVHELKIDKSFMHDLTPQSEAAVIVSSTIELARSLELRVVAEGVESVRVARFLREAGCTTLQGFIYSKPLIAEAMGEWLHEHAARHHHGAGFGEDPAGHNPDAS